MQNKFWTILALVAVVGLTAACDEESDTDPADECTPATVAEDCEAGESCIDGQCVTEEGCVDGANDCNGFLCDQGTCLTTCVGDVDCAEGFVCDTEEADCVEDTEPTYTQVLVISDTDIESVSNKFNPGPDIDAAKMTIGSDFFASASVGQTGAYDVSGDAEATTLDPASAIGEPDAVMPDGSDCPDENLGDLVFSLGAGPLGTEDGQMGIGYALLSNFADDVGDAPAFSLGEDSSDCITVYELNKVTDTTPELCPNLDVGPEDYTIYLADQDVAAADFTDEDGYVVPDDISDLIQSEQLVSFGTHSATATVCAGEEL